VAAIPPSDTELLRNAEQVLRGENFATRQRRIAEIDCLLAENAFFIVAIAAVRVPSDFIEVDRLVSVELVNEIASAQVRAKQWDVYLVLLTSALSSEDESELLHALTYDTHYLRRLVRVGVAATEEAVRESLRAFLPLPVTNGDRGGGDSLALLEEALVTRGIERPTAAEAVSEFRTSGRVADA
jgi:hypothetical protein